MGIIEDLTGMIDYGKRGSGTRRSIIVYYSFIIGSINTTADTRGGRGGSGQSPG